jgi:hypothetical protein
MQLQDLYPAHCRQTVVSFYEILTATTVRDWLELEILGRLEETDRS